MPAYALCVTMIRAQDHLHCLLMMALRLHRRFRHRAHVLHGSNPSLNPTEYPARQLWHMSTCCACRARSMLAPSLPSLPSFPEAIAQVERKKLFRRIRGLLSVILTYEPCFFSVHCLQRAEEYEHKSVPVTLHTSQAGSRAIITVLYCNMLPFD